MHCRRAALRARIHASYRFMNIVMQRQSGASIQLNRLKIKAGAGRKILYAGSGNRRRARFFWTARQSRAMETEVQCYLTKPDGAITVIARPQNVAAVISSLQTVEIASLPGCVIIRILRISSSITNEKRRLSGRFLNYDTACPLAMTKRASLISLYRQDPGLLFGFSLAGRGLANRNF